MLGGLARRVAMVERARSKGSEVLVVDSGDLFFEKKEGVDQERARTKAEILAKAYRKMGVVAVNVGDLDLLQGLEFLKKLSQEGLPLISANLVDAASGKLLFPPCQLKQVGSLKVAFVGLLGPEMSPQVQKAVAGKVAISDPWEAARKAMEELKGKADLLIVLSDMGTARNQRLARETQGVHFILGGHDGRFASSPQLEGSTWLFQSYSKGMYLGSLKLRLEEPAKPISDEGRASRLEQELAKLDGRIQAHRRAQERGQSASVERSLQRLQQQRTHLEQELAEARKAEGKGNRFSWRLEALDPSLPEDPEVARWIQEAGIQAD